MLKIIPSRLCLSCDVCCRFIDKNAALRPFFFPHEITSKIKPHLDKSRRVKLAPFQDMYKCSLFNAKNHKCFVYPKRPFDCQLYPFTIMFDETGKKIVLGIDKKCPFTANPENQNTIRDYFNYLVDLLEKEETASLIAKNPSFIGSYQDDVIKFSYLDSLTKKIITNPEKSGFKKISLKDKAMFEKSGYSFVNLYIWKEINPVWRKENCDKLEILIETGSGYIDFSSLKKFPDYIYLTQDLIKLESSKYRHKRSSYNYFSKNYKFQYAPYKQHMKNDCLKLFSKWARSRKQKFQDPYYHKLLEDSFSAHKLAIENFKGLGLTGMVIKIRKKICAYTFGFEITKDMFCVLLEVCDLRFKGISEFIFREFSKEMSRYKYINAMDDSGLENLRISKLSYHPIPFPPLNPQ